DALRRVLTEPKNAIVCQYEKLFRMDGVELTLPPDALDMIVDKAIEYKLGARGLRSIVETIMMDAMFETPSTDKKSVSVDAAYALRKLEEANFEVNRT
ncbi:MAG: ATP-dependent Clp protease ATP-binding subunit ClpX, partial [Paramuribaculum sp.]|nr:ATP-dependent Clp protease ATP-binding subunit ClpX [Paramuribaculum sp.]